MLNFTNSSSISLEDDSFWERNLMPIIEYTSYFFYSIIFLIGLTGNSVVIYVLLNSVCLLARYPTNNNNNNINAALVLQNQETAINNAKKNSLKSKKNINVSFKPDSMTANDKTSEKKSLKNNANLIINESTFEPSIVEDDINENNKLYSLLAVKTDNRRWVIKEFIIYIYIMMFLYFVIHLHVFYLNLVVTK